MRRAVVMAEIKDGGHTELKLASRMENVALSFSQQQISSVCGRLCRVRRMYDAVAVHRMTFAVVLGVYTCENRGQAYMDMISMYQHKQANVDEHIGGQAAKDAESDDISLYSHPSAAGSEAARVEAAKSKSDFEKRMENPELLAREMQERIKRLSSVTPVVVRYSRRSPLLMT